MRKGFTYAGLILLVDATATAFAKDEKPQKIEQRSVERRVTETAIWSIPAVNTDLMIQAASNVGAQAKQIVYWTRPLNWKNLNRTMRFYGPLTSVLDGSYRLPAVQLIQ